MAAEASTAPQSSPIDNWGRVVVIGGTNWATLGRKDKAANPDRPDLETPHVLRSLANVNITRIFAGHSACHAVFLDVKGAAWLVGRNEHGQLGTSNKDVINEPIPLASLAKAPAPLREAKIVHAGLGRSHTLLITDSGHVYAAGSNLYGCLGDESTKNTDVLNWKRITGALADEKAVMAACGVNFSVVLTESGRVYAFGTGEKGVLGNGRTGEHIMGGKVLFTEQAQPGLVRGLEGKKIVEIAAGQQHALARDDNGYVYSWGFGGLGRLGHGEQKDCLIAKPIYQFTHDREVMRAKKIVAGPTCTIVIDGQGVQYLAGKFKITGDGSSGQPWNTPRPVYEIQAYKIRLASAGSAAFHYIAAGETPKELVPIGFGQAALNGELGLGVGQPKSATKPQRVETLDGLDIIDLAAGQNTTFLLVRPPAVADDPELASSITQEEPWNSLPKFPPVFDAPETCVTCSQDKENDPPLECDKCEQPYHLGCLEPPLDALPPGEWFCSDCASATEEQQQASATNGKQQKGKRKAEASTPSRAYQKRKK